MLYAITVIVWLTIGYFLVGAMVMENKEQPSIPLGLLLMIVTPVFFAIFLLVFVFIIIPTEIIKSAVSWIWKLCKSVKKQGLWGGFMPEEEKADDKSI